MLALVRIALRRPYTFVVLALLILIFGTLSALRTPTDIFPDIQIPVISVVWQYTGLPPDQMNGRVMTPFERALTTTVNDIEHIEGVSYAGFGVVKIFFQPTADIRTANAQVTAVSQTQLKLMPAGITPPLVLNYSASTVPIIQLALSGKGMSEQTLSDLGTNMIRTQLITVPGASLPLPFGGKTREVQIDLDPAALQARGLSGQDVALALATQNLILPAGTQKIGKFEYTMQLNNSPTQISGLADLPVKTVNGATIYLHDVAHVRDGYPPQTNIVHVDGARSVLLTVEKSGAASTLAIIQGIKAKMAQIKATLPDALVAAPIGDQSVFVTGAISSVVHEGVIAASLTSLMILLFLGSWRSTVIIATSIPLSILGSVTALSLLGETLNIMTLGGLALAVGILVDDATVTIENINWHLEHGKDVEPAILDGAKQIVTPAFVSLLCICIADGHRRRTRGAAIPQPTGALSARFRGALRAAARPVSRRAATRAQSPPRVRDRVSRFRAGFVPARADAGPKFLPRSRFGAGPDARSPAGRNARRGQCQRVRQDPERHPWSHSCGRVGHAGRQRRHARQRYQSDLQQHRHHGLAGRRYPDLAEARSPSDCRIRAQAAGGAAPALPGSHLLFPARRHRQPDSELRRPCPDRSAGARTRFACGFQIRGRAVAPCPPRARHRRCAYPGVSGQPRLQRRRGSGARAVRRLDRARRHEQPAGDARRQQPGCTHILARPGQRRAVLDRDADSAVPGRFAR